MDLRSGRSRCSEPRGSTRARSTDAARGARPATRTVKRSAGGGSPPAARPIAAAAVSTADAGAGDERDLRRRDLRSTLRLRELRAHVEGLAGDGGAIVGGGANAANGPVGSGMPTGRAMAAKSTPSAASMASTNCRSFTVSTKAASGSARERPRARARVAASPRASAGTQADGSSIAKRRDGGPTSRLDGRQGSAAPAGAGRPQRPNRPGNVVSMPSKKLFSLSGAATALPSRTK